MKTAYLVDKLSSRVARGLPSFLSDEHWQQAHVLNDFSYPWPGQQDHSTCFRALYDDNSLYLRYEVEDDQVQTFHKINDKLEVVFGDRVEVFFAQKEGMNPYYCLEMDPTGRVLDYEAAYYRKFKMSWSWPKGQLAVRSLPTSKGYQVDVTLGLQSLKDLGLLEDGQLRAGLYRANCITLTNSPQKESDIEWVSWIDPKTTAPDFHVPSSFGILKLQD